jgi:uncharacterized SAM-binding protein YcdF (DUF218 family)
VALSHTTRRNWIIVALIAAGLVATHPLWLGALGKYLVRPDEPVRADAALVLGGDGYGRRILRAAELARQGYIGTILVSGPEGMYGHNEAELAIPFAVGKGHPASLFVACPHRALSTREEAQALSPELRRRGVHKCMIVTSDYHTRRAGAIFRSVIPDVEFRVVAAEDEFFRAEGWWKTRQGQKLVLLEWMKTISTWFGV